MAMLNHGESDSVVRAAYVKQSRALRRAAAAKVSPEVRRECGKKGMAARWAKYKPDENVGMTNDEFRTLLADMTAQQIADALGITYAKVLTWRRKANPIRIGIEDAAKIRALAESRKGTKA